MPRKNSFVDSEPIEEKNEEVAKTDEELKKIQNEGKKLFSNNEGGTRLS